MQLNFTGELIYWRGPSPYYYVMVPDEESADIHSVSAQVTYGWGVIPVSVTVKGTTWDTSLFPREGGYALPVRKSVRDAEHLELGDVLDVELSIELKFD